MMSVHEALFFVIALLTTVPAIAEARRYGPLILDFSRAQKMRQSIVVQGINPQKQPFFTAVLVCGAFIQFHWYWNEAESSAVNVYLRCVPFWRAPGGTRTHVSGNCWVRLS